MTLITRKKLGQQAQTQRQEIRQLRKLLEANRWKEPEQPIDHQQPESSRCAPLPLQGLRLVRHKSN